MPDDRDLDTPPLTSEPVHAETSDGSIPAGFLSNAEFRTHAAPAAEALRRLVDAARHDRPESFLPNADSAAMRDTANQIMFPDSDEGAVDVARTLTSQRLRAGEDHIRAICDLWMVDSEAYVWSVPVLGRAALESFALGFRLCDPGIDGRLRAARTINELIDSAQAVDRLPGDVERPEVRAAHRVGQAESMGLTRVLTKKGKPTPWFEERRPGCGAAVRALFGDDDLGGAIYNFWSAVAHGSSWGLSETLGQLEHGPLGAGVRAPIVLSLRTVMTTAMVVAFGHHAAIERLASWTGWTLSTYDPAYASLRKLYLEHLGESMSEPDCPEEREVRLSDLLWMPADHGLPGSR